MIKAVIFDLDGVITDTAKYHYEAWKKIADELGIPFNIEYNEKLKGVSRMESLCLILDNGPGRDSLTLEEKNELCERKNEIYKELIGSLKPSDILPGINEFISELKKNNILIGLASVSKNAPEILNRLELRDSFDYMADASVLGPSDHYRTWYHRRLQCAICLESGLFRILRHRSQSKSFSFLGSGIQGDRLSHRQGFRQDRPGLHAG